MPEQRFPALSRLAVILAAGAGILVLAGVGVYFYYSYPLPAGKAGPEAEELTAKIEAWMRSKGCRQYLSSLVILDHTFGT